MTHLCTFRTVPTAGNECREMLWSEGRACLKCLVECPQRGMDQGQVLVENMRRVEAKRAELGGDNP